MGERNEKGFDETEAVPANRFGICCCCWPLLGAANKGVDCCCCSCSSLAAALSMRGPAARSALRPLLITLSAVGSLRPHASPPCCCRHCCCCSSARVAVEPAAAAAAVESAHAQAQCVACVRPCCLG